MINKERLKNLSDDIWKGAIALRGKFKAKDFPSIILPMIMIRRIECVLIEKRKQIKADLLQKNPSLSNEQLQKKIKITEINKLDFYNKSGWTLTKILKENPSQVESNFRDYINSYSDNIEDIIDNFEYRVAITKMVKANKLASIMQLVKEKDFSPSNLSNIEMGYVYEELLQKFSQDDAKDTGEHFTPREIIRIMVELMEIDFDPATATKAISIYDPACGTGGMLSITKEHLLHKTKTPEEIKNTEKLILLNGQESLPSNYAVCKADMILKGENHINITLGNSLIADIESLTNDRGDHHQGEHFDYLISNPPFGVNWSDYKTDALKLTKSRYKWGTPDIGDGALLFLLSLIEKMKPKKQGGSKIAILFNGSPLSNGDALSGESEIRRNILENDLLDTILMMPDQMFYNTGIYTYIWILNNNKPAHKKDQVQIINARNQCEKEPKAFGNKRNRITDNNRTWIHKQFSNWQTNEHCKHFNTKDFAFYKVKIVFWQEDENNQPMWITEPFESQLNNSNINTKFKLYGDFEITLKIDSPFKDNQNKNQSKGSTLEQVIKVNGTKPFETKLAEQLQQQVPQLKDEKLNDIKKWFKAQNKTATYHHRHYISDTEYIPYDLNQPDKKQHIKNFLAKEIDYQIISWQEVEQLGYEILPNKYFYQYIEPESSEKLMQDFWALEKETEALLSGIRDL
jgi:type I restriction enzyme M protein